MNLIFFCIFPFVYSYLELSIFRHPKQEQTNSWDGNKCNITKQVSQYTQICYHKDITYSLLLLHHTQLYYLAIDFTTPISWLKGPQCKIEKQKKYCSKIENSIAGQIKKSLKRIKKQLKTQFMMFDPSEQIDQVITIGSLDKIQGKLQKAKNVTFITKDKGKYINFFDLLLMTFYLSTQQRIIQLKNTNFVKAEQISSHTNRLSDGAISFRFDEQSQKSFLNQIFQFLQSTQKFITIYLDNQNSVITIGDLSAKNAEGGYGGIQWIKLDQNKYPLITSMFFQYMQNQTRKQQKIRIQAIITLSASYIAIPLQLLKNLIIHLSQLGSCKIGLYSFLQCRFIKKYQEQRITFKMQQIKLSFQIKDLTRFKKGNIITLSIRVSETEYIILGEPLFKKYFVAFDYGTNKIGVAERRKDDFPDNINLVPIIRFLLIGFILGCGVLLCYIPCKIYSSSPYNDQKFKKTLKKPEKKKQSIMNQKLMNNNSYHAIIETDMVNGI